MKCITCGDWTEYNTFCDDHANTVVYGRRLDRAFDTQFHGEFSNPSIAEKLLSGDRRPATLRRVVKWMFVNGFKDWIKVLHDETAQSLKIVATPIGRERILVAVWHVQTSLLNAMEDIRSEYAQSDDKHTFVFDWNEWPKIRHELLDYYPWQVIDQTLLNFMPRTLVQSSSPDTMVALRDGSYSCQLAINRGQIVGGEWVATTTGVSDFLHLFDGAVTIGRKKMGRFGKRCVAPATLANLETIVTICRQPMDIKIEAIAEAWKNIKISEALAGTFQQRMSTELYDKDDLHRYVYREEQDDLLPWESKKVKLLEDWDKELNLMGPYSQQKITAEASYTARYVSWWIDMRVGKTPTLLMLMSKTLEAHEVDHWVVVAPAINVYEPWYSELERQGKFRVCVLDEGSALDEENIKSEAFDVYVISYTSLVARLPIMQWYWSMENIGWGFDETSMIKNPQSQRAKACYHATEHAKFVYNLNGTPLAQGPQDIWSQQIVVDRGVTFGVSFAKFVNRWLQRSGPGKFKINKDVATLFELMLAGSSIRYIRSEADQFSGKDKNFRYIEVPPTSEMKRDTEEILKGFTRDSQDNEAEIKTCILTVFGHLRECCAGYRKWEVVPDSGIYKRARHKKNPKVIWLRSFLKGNPGQPAVIFSENSEMEDAIMEMLKAENISYSFVRPYKGTSSLTGQQRLEQIQKFQNGETRVIMMKSVSAKGVTLNRLPAVKAGLGTYPVIIYTQPTWSLIDWEQSQDRCVGSDPKTKKSIGTMIYALIVRGSIEGKIVGALRSKKKVAETLLADASRNGYNNPFEEMDLTDSGEFESDEFFDAEDMEARYKLELAPQKKLSEKMIIKADLKYRAKMHGTTHKAQEGKPLSEHAQYLLSKFGGSLPFARIGPDVIEVEAEPTQEL